MLIEVGEGCVEALWVRSNAESDKRSYLPFGYLQVSQNKLCLNGPPRREIGQIRPLPDLTYQVSLGCSGERTSVGMWP